MYNKMIPKTESGFTLVEVLMAVALLSFGLLALGMMQAHFAQANAQSRQMIHAADIATNKIEELTYADSGSGDPLEPNVSHEETVATNYLNYDVKWNVTEAQTETGEDILEINLWVEYTEDNHKVSFDWVRAE